ncbi:MAG: hypothetical protein ACOY0T_11395 [Myxococcota bacterium]
MPSQLHEALLLLFRNCPDLAARLLREALGVPVPEYNEVRIESADLTQVTPTEYRADLVLVLLHQGRPVLCLIVEVQLAPHVDKCFSWPVYATLSRARFRCDALVVVVTPHRDVARWAAKPLRIGGHNVFSPLVIGPDAIPTITDPALARAAPELSVLSTMAHGRGDVELAVRIATAATAGLEQVRDPDDLVLYSDLINAALSEAARKAFQMIPPGYELQSELVRTWVAKGRTEGELRGKQAALLAVIESRNLVLSGAEREKILATRDAAELERWLRRVGTVSSVELLWSEA